MSSSTVTQPALNWKKKICKSDIVHAKCKEDMFKLIDGGSKFSVTVHEHMHDVKGHSKIN